MSKENKKKSKSVQPGHEKGIVGKKTQASGIV